MSGIIKIVCCAGPLILIFLGLGSLGIGAVLSRYHYIFLSGGSILLIVSWFYYLKEVKRCKANNCEIENKRKTLTTLIIATLIVGLFAILNIYPHIEKQDKDISLAKGEYKIVEIPVKGMTCFTCEVAVSSALKKVNGVIKAEASVRKQSAKVIYDPKSVTLKELIEAINKTGYKAEMPK
ncbi:MAG: mercuric transporter MerT family protein [Candidatus Ratteibacteria bacterium]